jgi:CheY-like chemotaxis protein
VSNDIDDLAELRVLIVDDNVDAATSLSYLLQMIGCKTAVAFGGEMGVRVAELFQPSLMFLDLNMPGHDGCEVLTRIKSLQGRTAQAMSICLTATGQGEDEQRCLAAGFDQYVQKPLEPQVLSDMLLLARARQTGVTHGWWPTATDAHVEPPGDTPLDTSAPPLPRE